MLAPYLFIALCFLALLCAICRQPRHDASAERPNTDRRSLSGGAAKPLFHADGDTL